MTWELDETGEETRVRFSLHEHTHTHTRLRSVPNAENDMDRCIRGGSGDVRVRSVFLHVAHNDICILGRL